MRPPRREQEERVLGRARVSQNESSLAEIVEHERGRHDREPSELDRPPAEMTHVGVERLGAGQHQEGGAEHREADAGSGMRQVGDRMVRTERAEDRRAAHDPETPSRAIAMNHTSITGPKMPP